jgi:hypothetical protein
MCKITNIQTQIKKLTFTQVETKHPEGTKIEIQKICSCDVEKFGCDLITVNTSIDISFKPETLFNLQCNYLFLIQTSEMLGEQEFKDELNAFLPTISREIFYLISTLTNAAYGSPFFEKPEFDKVTIKMPIQ